MNMHKFLSKELKKHRVITMLDRHEIDFLDKLGKDAMFTTGHKLSHSEILRALIDFAMDLKLSGENISTLNDLKKRIVKKMYNCLVENSSNHHVHIGGL